MDQLQKVFVRSLLRVKHSKVSLKVARHLQKVDLARLQSLLQGPQRHPKEKSLTDLVLCRSKLARHE